MRGAVRLGRYMDTGSWIHELDPRAKLIAMMLYFALIVSVNTLYALTATVAASLLVLYWTRIPYRLYWRTLRPLKYLIAFMFVFPIALGEGSFLQNTEQGVLAAGRMSLFVTFTALLTFTTDPSRLTQGVEALLAPLRRIGVSPEKWSLMLNLAIRFIPVILEEANIVMKAQASRGADFQERSWKAKAKVLLTLLVPITAGAFRRAQDLIDSMESRGYEPGRPRSSYTALVWSPADTGFIAGFALLLLLLIMFRI